jgi:hypothetical protein
MLSQQQIMAGALVWGTGGPEFKSRRSDHQIRPLAWSSAVPNTRRDLAPHVSSATCPMLCPLAASAFSPRDGLRRNQKRHTQERPIPLESFLRPCGGTYMPANPCEVLNVTIDVGGPMYRNGPNRPPGFRRSHSSVFFAVGTKAKSRLIWTNVRLSRSRTSVGDRHHSRSADFQHHAVR